MSVPSGTPPGGLRPANDPSGTQPAQGAAPGAFRARALALFCLSGVLALIVDLAVLYALKRPLGPYAARGVSWLAAASFTWAFNRSITFSGPGRAGWAREYMTYLGSMAVGGLINYGVYAACVRWWPLATDHAFLGVVAGSLVSIVFNFAAAGRILSPRQGRS
jgi:putative flippase GtrA